MQLPGDFSNFDHPVSEMFHFPFTAEEREQYALTEKQIAFFHENGYLSGVKVLEEWQVDEHGQSSMMQQLRTDAFTI